MLKVLVVAVGLSSTCAMLGAVLYWLLHGALYLMGSGGPLSPRLRLQMGSQRHGEMR